MGSETHLLPHVVMVSFPGQGHINPLLRLAKRLASKGLYITFTTTSSAGKMIQTSSTNNTSDTTIKIGQGELRFEYFSDGWAEDDVKRFDLDSLMNQLETVGRDSFVQLVKRQADELGRPVSCIINNPFVPWVSDVATDMEIPCAVLWVQSCAVYSAYYHYFHKLASFPTPEQPDRPLEIPGLPTLESDEVPSFLHPLDPYESLMLAILEQFKNLSKSFAVLVDSFEELEQEAIHPMLNLSPIKPVGPLFKFNDNEEKTNSIRGDMWSTTDECIKWLDSKPAGSVVYVSFGSIVTLGKDQMEEIAKGLLNSGQPFLWVVKPPPEGISGDDCRLPDGFIEEAEGKGLVVQWCPQDRVLAHGSVGCFVTHCGWNSSMESLSLGVPIVAAPQWGDQVTNAKFLVDVYGVGVRLGRNSKDLKTVSREQVEKCVIEVTRGLKAEEIKKNALKWKKIAEEAVAKGGSSDKNLQEFVDDIRRKAFNK
ncbi:hypothetical protein AQUCO_08300033v1 [Aquilegia coerulea]|uniref:Glycosyltransferase n=1 Tax=Aquilegia coerulea TaxID=218851 RepID=A0A2G5C704_AQUCA|nr:hypothetical protein AQUCO_08300033v1 [Aquilegia coerulea]